MYKVTYYSEGEISHTETVKTREEADKRGAMWKNPNPWYFTETDKSYDVEREK